MGCEEQPEEIARDPRESPYELPPLVRRPLADRDEKERAVRRLIAQAERERAEGV